MQAWGTFLGILDGTPEGDGTLLDRMLVVAHSETELAKDHNITNMPIMFAGLAGGRVRSGLSVIGQSDPVSRIGLTAMQVMGVPVDRFGAGSMETNQAGRRSGRLNCGALPYGGCRGFHHAAKPEHCALALVALTVGWPVDAGARSGQEPPPATPPEITIGSTPVGPVFADAEGYTLYVTRRDEDPDVSTCLGECASVWPPVRASAGAAAVRRMVTHLSGEDGAPQWAYRGRPLYRYRWEEETDWAIGQGDLWQFATVDPFPDHSRRRRSSYLRTAGRQTRFAVEAAPPGIVAETTPHGLALADARGMTLYVAPAGCEPACGDRWTPLRAPAAAVPTGDWSVVTRDDGRAQWAFKGQPLYRCTGDVMAGDVSCVAEGGRIVEVPPALMVADEDGGG